jgi:cytochrome c oxidase subunit II
MWHGLPQAWTDPKGPVAAAQLWLFSLSYYISLVLLALVTVVLLYNVFRFRERKGEQREALQIHGNSKLEITWTLLPILILVAVSIPTVRLAFKAYKPDKPADVEVRAIGHQWFFNFEYPNYGFTVSNELVIPAGKVVSFKLTSVDVIHSFWVPKLAGKTDMIPGRENIMWFQADEPGMYYGHCAEFCSTAHAQMRFRVRAVTPEEFNAWVADRKQGAKLPTEPVALAGKALFEGAQPSKATCFACHTVEGTKAKAEVGPNLTNIGARPTIGAGLIENTDANLRRWVRNPLEIKPGVKMPAHQHLSDEELTQIVAYLRSLK